MLPPDVKEPKAVVVLGAPKGVLVFPPPNIEDVLAVVTAVELPNNELLVPPPPKMPLPDPDDPPKTFLEAASDDGFDPRPLKNPPLPPNMLPPLAVVVGLFSVLPPNIDVEFEVLLLSELFNELPPKIDVDDAVELEVVDTLGALLKELPPKMELEDVVLAPVVTIGTVLEVLPPKTEVDVVLSVPDALVTF